MLAFLVTHDEVHELLPAYAAGELDEDAADAVRGHLATGCTTCLSDLFARPVGRPAVVALPEAREEAAPVTWLSPTADDAERGRASVPSRHRERWAFAAILILGVALIALGTWNIYDLRLHEVMHRENAARLTRHLAEAEATKADLAARLQTLGNDLVAAREEAARHADAVRATAEEAARLDAEREAAQEQVAMLTRGVRRRDFEIDRLLGSADQVTAGRELLATPGVELLRLRSVPPFVDVHGHVVWHPERDIVLLYAFDLPPLAEGARYRVWLDLGGREDRGPAFSPGPRGDAVVTLRVTDGAEGLRGVRVVREPTAEPVLAGETGRSAG